MKFINLKSSASKDALLDAIKNSEKVNERVKFDDKQGRPHIRVKEKKKGGLYITCEMIGGPSKDNGFIVGTFFWGRLTERDGVSRLRGIILTAPLYHLLLIAFCVYFLIQCFIVGGITLVPVFLALFSLVLFKGEFKKQGIIERFFKRAIRFVENNQGEK